MVVEGEEVVGEEEGFGFRSVYFEERNTTDNENI